VLSQVPIKHFIPLQLANMAVIVSAAPRICTAVPLPLPFLGCEATCCVLAAILGFVLPCAAMWAWESRLRREFLRSNAA